jgi:hypothetical protein
VEVVPELPKTSFVESQPPPPLPHHPNDKEDQEEEEDNDTKEQTGSDAHLKHQKSSSAIPSSSKEPVPD